MVFPPLGFSFCLLILYVRTNYKFLFIFPPINCFSFFLKGTVNHRIKYVFLFVLDGEVMLRWTSFSFMNFSTNRDSREPILEAACAVVKILGLRSPGLVAYHCHYQQLISLKFNVSIYTMSMLIKLTSEANVRIK